MEALTRQARTVEPVPSSTAIQPPPPRWPPGLVATTSPSTELAPAMSATARAAPASATATIARATQPTAGNPGITARNSKATAAGGTATSSREISICLGAVPQFGRHE